MTGGAGGDTGAGRGGGGGKKATRREKKVKILLKGEGKKGNLLFKILKYKYK